MTPAPIIAAQPLLANDAAVPKTKIPPSATLPLDLTRWRVRQSWAMAMERLMREGGNGAWKEEHSGELSNDRVLGMNPLLPPGLLKAEIPMCDKSFQTVSKAQREVANIVNKRDDRLLVLVGPCSIHDPDAALEYGMRLKDIADRHSQDLCIIMRAYLEKPRTTVGWKGLVNDPDIDGSCDLNHGLRVSRSLYSALTGVAGIPIAGEILETALPPYLAEFMSLGAIGARTTESQPHRQIASSMPFPIGFKNGTDGSLTEAINSITSAASSHSFAGGIADNGWTQIVRSSGNTDCFLILRGGSSGPNYHDKDVRVAQDLLSAQGHRTGIMIDCSHGNSEKNYKRQPLVARDVGAQLRAGQEAIIGVMIESNLHEGKQGIPNEGPEGLQRGVSVTDGCIGWNTTVDCLEQLAEAVQVRRAVTKS
ncbi:3-deoxy-7-phosphoheptulonate synthase [Uncinocarpus reesii 1704]|uniref:3-deoxy-7-phosphoheptulonate synthase n=1 Tax=Uncinocarpus reesii (strain UAMH 1704) TaxID=336963 RepID=C4JD73_UNCRE|nr:3-deoxy-7-phosphoheptulonate synthase [Uncinocarpus reesii 1704]EEP75432.1 3-deoxy-7-phosphoheptulonate synthase [Uncinocarpus reesii 1704]